MRNRLKRIHYRPDLLGGFGAAVIFDGTRVTRLATDNEIRKFTVYAYPHEGIDVLATRSS